MVKRVGVIAVLIMAVCAFGYSEKRVVFIGDSVTDGGWGRSGGRPYPSSERDRDDLNHIFGHSYMIFCATEYLNRNPEAGYEFFNRGIGGDDLARIEARWDEDVLSLCPDVVSILVGTNDVHYCLENDTVLDAADWDKRYRALLDRTRAENPDVKYVLGIPFSMQSGRLGAAPDYAMRDSLTRVLAKHVRSIAVDYNAAVVPYDSLFTSLLREHAEVAPEYWIWDGIHPTAAAHRRMAELWVAVCDSASLIE